jgi:site-specific DNA recombinase
MIRNQRNGRPATLQRVRCAVYTRKSTEEGLEQEFNSLDAQRESGEAFITSQQHEGWTCLPQRYDDGGFGGGNMDRPALQRLLADMAAGHIDGVVVYKVDRLSRSLLDFAKMMETFDKHRIAFVSVTQQFNTASSMGRLILNVLLSFAQFEREIISERTRDKIAATKRKGKWCGGVPILGYDLDPQSTKLVVNDQEAVRVRAIFELYLRLQTLRAVVQELDRRGWRNKRWRTRRGHERGGKPFTNTSLHLLLTSVLYVGKIKHKRVVHPGEHQGIVAEGVWQQAQELLTAHSQTKRLLVNRFGALLKGLLHCLPCGCPMTPTHVTTSSKRYRYYLCTAARKLGRHDCPAPSIAALSVEQVVLEQLKEVSQDCASVQALLAHDWPTLATSEQTRLLRLLLQRVDYDASAGKLVLVLHPRGPQRLAEELTGEHHDVAQN